MKRERIVVIVSIGLLAVLSLYFLFKNSQSTPKSHDSSQVILKMAHNFPMTSSSPEMGNVCTQNKPQLLNLINYFESLQKKKDAKDVLKLFITPIKDTDLKTYNFLSGNGASSPGLYKNEETNFNLSFYGIIDNPAFDNLDGSCSVNVVEQRFYSNNKDNGLTKEFLVKLNMVKQKNYWLIDSYQNSQDQGKYSGW